MRVSRREAYNILEVPYDADEIDVRETYKRLALKWYPEKHGNSKEAFRKFFTVNAAYARLAGEEYESDDEIDLSMPEMIAQFKEALCSKEVNGYDSSDYDDDDDDDDDGDPIHSEQMFHMLSGLKHRPGLHSHGQNHSGAVALSPEEIEKNANELITEEEKEKRKAEKRRAKKKRRRERKRLEKVESKKKDDDSTRKIDGERIKNKKDKKSKDTSGSEEEDFDPNAAFFTKVVNKKKKSGPVPENPAAGKVKGKHGVKGEEDVSFQPEELESVVLRSRQLAIGGNEMAQLGHYSAAIDLFTDAIKLDPRDFRFFGNRSYCYDRIGQYEKALRDAEKAVNLAPDWPKGYFRKGRALAGLKLYADAEQAFMQVLKLDRNCEDAMQELLRVRTYQLTEMGFTRQQAEAAIRQHNNVQQALDSLLAGVVAENSLSGEVYVSEEDEPHQAPVLTPASIQTKANDIKMDPTNPEGLTALWVGNVLPEVTDKRLTQMFSKYGSVTSVRCLPEKYCAFINFKTKESAGKAMQGLQGMECCGQRLLIKFPDNPICNGNVVIRKNPQPASVVSATPAVVPSPASASTSAAAKSTEMQPEQLSPSALDQKMTGPVNGNECYFWRTTGCDFGKNCRYKHDPEHKGIDKKPWHRVK